MLTSCYWDAVCSTGFLLKTHFFFEINAWAPDSQTPDNSFSTLKLNVDWKFYTQKYKNPQIPFILSARTKARQLFFSPRQLSNHQICKHKSIFESLLQKKSCRAFVRAPQNRVLDSSEAFVINSEHFLAHLVTRRCSYSAVILLFQKKFHACWQDTTSKWVALHIFLGGTTYVVPPDRHDVWFSNETYLVEVFEGTTFVVILKQRNHHLTHSGGGLP